MGRLVGIYDVLHGQMGNIQSGWFAVYNAKSGMSSLKWAHQALKRDYARW